LHIVMRNFGDDAGVDYAVIAAALTSVGATRIQDAVAAELLLYRRYWSPAPWMTVRGVRICVDEHSYRTHGGRLTQQQLEVVDEALGVPTNGDGTD
jgi:hypothetical protein